MRLEIDPIIDAPPVSDEVQEQDHVVDVVSAEARSMLNQGIKAAQAGNRPLARMSLQRATELDAKNETAWLWLASISEYPEELLGFLNHVLKINPENQRANEWKAATHALLSKTFVQRGIDACEENQRELAAECFQTALEYDDRNATAYLWVASLSDSHVVKIALLEKVLEIEPGNDAATTALDAARADVAHVRMNEAKAAAVSGNNTEAVRILDDLLTVNPDSIDALTMKSHLAEGFDEKIRCFENILAVDPNNLAARSGRDSLLAIFGTIEAAEAECSKYSVPGPSGAGDVSDEPPSNDLFEAAAIEVSEEYLAETSFDAVAEMEPAEEPEIAANAFDDVSYFYESAHSAYQETEVENDYDPVQAVAQPFATLAEEVSEPQANDIETVNVQDEWPEISFEGEPDHAPEPQPDYADPQAETVAFSYAEHSEVIAAVEEEPPSLSGEFVIPMPDSDLPVTPSATNPDAPVDVEDTLDVKPESFDCVFCGNANEPQSISCQTCLAVLTLSDLELLLSNQNANKLILRQAVEEMERQRSGREFSSDELVALGLGHLNLRDLQLGYACLADASRLDPNDVILASQVNSLLIRLEEIRLQEEAHLRMPRGKSILVVDDSPTVRKLIAGKLEKSGHDVICANDGVEAMERLDDLIPDLILLDITMPRMDGYQVCKNIRSKTSTKDVPVVMISGKDGFFDKVRGRMAGTTGYITKPFGPETLMKTVEMYLSGEAPDLDEV